MYGGFSCRGLGGKPLRGLTITVGLGESRWLPTLDWSLTHAWHLQARRDQPMTAMEQCPLHLPCFNIKNSEYSTENLTGHLFKVYHMSVYILWFALNSIPHLKLLTWMVCLPLWNMYCDIWWASQNASAAAVKKTCLSRRDFKTIHHRFQEKWKNIIASDTESRAE